MTTPDFFIAAGSGFGLIYWLGFCWHKSGNWPRSIVKTGAVALLALGGLLASAPLLVVAGLIAGAAGDFFLSRPGRSMLKTGIAVFGLGHLCYIAQFSRLAAWSLLWADPLRATFVLLLVVTALSTEVWLARRTGRLRWPVRGYGLVIALMVLAGLAVPAPGFALGAGLFLISDLLLSLSLFVVEGGRYRKTLSLLLWPAYWAGQFFILHSALAPEIAV